MKFKIIAVFSVISLAIVGYAGTTYLISPRDTNSYANSTPSPSASNDNQSPVSSTAQEVVNLPKPFVVHPGGTAWLTAGTLSGSECAIQVTYLSGPSVAQGLYPKTADNSGQVRWDWFIGTRTTPGDWPVDVTCTKDEQSKSARTYIYVR